MEALRAEATGGERSSRAVWHRRFLSVWPGVRPREAREWHHGARDTTREARWCRLVVVADAERTSREEGGEAGWLRRRENVYGSQQRQAFDVGKDGYAEGWEEAALELLRIARWDGEGYFVDEDGSSRLTEEDAGVWPPCLQLLIRARLAVTRLVQRKLKDPLAEVKVHEKYQGKLRENTVNLEVLGWNVTEAAIWQARMRITVAVATDGSWDSQASSSDCVGGPAAWGVVRHDGSTNRSRFDVREGADNYIAELVALIQAVAAEADGERLMITFDATSPVLALLGFRESHDRTKQQYNADYLLDTLDQELARMEVVVLLWQTSHVGAPANEWVDMVADVKREDEQDPWPEPWTATPRRAPRHYSMKLTAPGRAVYAWAKERASIFVRERLAKSVRHTQLREFGDLPIGEMPDEFELFARGVRSSRRCPGDERYYRNSTMRELVRFCGCPFGCKVMDAKRGELVGAPFTWSHVQFFCAHPELEEARDAWVRGEVKANRRGQGSGGGGLYALKVKLESGGRGEDGCYHEQVNWVIDMAEQGTEVGRGARTRSSSLQLDKVDFGEDDVRLGKAESCCRAVGGLWRPTGGSRRDGDKRVLRAAKEVVVAGLRVQQLADELSKVWRRELQDEAKVMGKQRGWARRWRKRVALAGPGAAAEHAKLEALGDGYRSVLGVALRRGDLTVAQHRGALRRLEVQRRRRKLEIRGTCGCRRLSGEEVHPAVWWLIAGALGVYLARRRRRDPAFRRLGEDPSGVSLDAARGAEYSEKVAPGGLLGGVRHRVSWSNADRWTAALRKYICCGGRRMVVATGVRLRKERDSALVAAQAAGFQRVFTRTLQHVPVGAGWGGGGGARVAPDVSGSLSGSSLQPVGTLIRWTRVNASARGRQKRQRRRRVMAKERVVRELRRGSEADDGGRWAVEEILEVARAATRGRRVLVKVRWAGEDDDGDAW